MHFTFYVLAAHSVRLVSESDYLVVLDKLTHAFRIMFRSANARVTLA